MSSYAELLENQVHITSVELLGETPVTLITSDQSRGRYPAPPMSEFTLQLVTKGSPKGRVVFGGDRISGRAAPGSLLLSPTDADLDYEIDGHLAVTAIAFPKTALIRFSEQNELNAPSDFGALHQRIFNDTFLQSIVERVAKEAGQAHPLSAAFVDVSIQSLIAAALLKTKRLDVETPESRLSKRQIDTVVSMIEDMIEEDVRISWLAAEIRIPEWKFIRLFRTTFNCTPYQYIMSCRMMRAKDMLSHSDKALADIAYACGFSSQSHMNDVFRKKLGVTPGRYRRETRG